MNSDQEKTVEAYDKAAVAYNERNNKHFWITEFDTFCGFVGGKKILDIGCGAGRDAEEFLKNDFDYLGIDASAGMLSVAKTRTGRDDIFRQMDFLHLDFPSEAFDGFWAAASLLHIPKQDLPRVLGGIRRITKQGGIGFVSVKKKSGFEEGVIHQDRNGGGRSLLCLLR